MNLIGKSFRSTLGSSLIVVDEVYSKVLRCKLSVCGIKSGGYADDRGTHRLYLQVFKSQTLLTEFTEEEAPVIPISLKEAIKGLKIK